MSGLRELAAAADPALAAYAVADPGEGRFTDVPGPRGFVLEAVYEGYLMHYGKPRAFAGMDRDLRLLAGDALYALGLARLAEAGDLEAVAALADLISESARVHAEGKPAEAEALWDAIGSRAARALRNQVGIRAARSPESIADPVADSPKKFDSNSRYTEGRGIAGAWEGETVTRRRLMEGTALAAGGIATMAFALPGLGFALGPLFEETVPDRWEDLGDESDFTAEAYVPRVMNVDPEIGDAGKATVYVRRWNPEVDNAPGKSEQPYVAISTRCAHLGCPVRYIQASQKFVCPCHGGVYDSQGKVEGGPPVRPLDRFETRVVDGRVQVGQRFSLNSQLERFPPRDPSNHLDGLWKYLYPPRPTT